MRSTFLFVVMVVMAKTAYGQVIDGGIVEGAIDWVLGTHFTFNGELDGKGLLVGPEDLVAYPWGQAQYRVGRQFNGLKSVIVHQRADLTGNHHYCILTYRRDWCNGEPTSKTELDVSHEHPSVINLNNETMINSAQVIAGACKTVVAPWYTDGVRDKE